MLCRFTGAVARFYSVAEHCLAVSRLVAPELALTGLLHDASEAYICDVSSPVKYSDEFSPYRAIEARIQRAVYQRFGLAEETPAPVVAIDKAICALEASLLYLKCPAWVRKPLPELPGAAIVGLPPGDAEVLYLERFKELTT